MQIEKLLNISFSIVKIQTFALYCRTFLNIKGTYINRAFSGTNTHQEKGENMAYMGLALVNKSSNIVLDKITLNYKHTNFLQFSNKDTLVNG